MLECVKIILTGILFFVVYICFILVKEKIIKDKLSTSAYKMRMKLNKEVEKCENNPKQYHLYASNDVSCYFDFIAGYYEKALKGCIVAHIDIAYGEKLNKYINENKLKDIGKIIFDNYELRRLIYENFLLLLTLLSYYDIEHEKSYKIILEKLKHKSDDEFRWDIHTSILWH